MKNNQIKLANRLVSVQESATLSLNAKVKQMAAGGRTVYNLTAGELATDTPGYIQSFVAERLHLNKYTPVAGLPELRVAVALHASEFYGLDWIRAENVVATTGVKAALSATFLALLNPGDEVIVPVPGWTTSYRPLIELAGGIVVEVPLTAEYDIDPTAIEAALTAKTKLVIVNSPHNPTGTVFSREALESLARLLNEKNITVIADDIYTKIIYQDNIPLVPTCGFNNLVVVNGFSKSQAITGWRIGYLIADKLVADAVASLLSHMTGNAPLPSQYAALAALQHDDQPPLSTISALRAQRQLVLDTLDASGIPHNSPGGAFYVFLDLRGLTNDSALWCSTLLNETGVALVPGEAFSASGFARLTFVAEKHLLTEALEHITTFAQKGLVP
ncbi:aminotransferase class I/II-fold pyridoxal phosphate-dependent enzyme [Candidatus Saccharibacteria bacterium]|nr:MAG: aminotransferase class I/II-fold pyridoxal phosphate-dependent enzyme [Candidatus Saccharibacteria bacterium]